MCGIAGKLNFDSTQPIDEALLRQMTDVLRHRGPDDEGVWANGQIGLGHRRLAIVDLSPAGHQPMTNEDGTIWLTFNGEIYNHLELRAKLEQRGHHYQSCSDTETIIHLYEDYGRDCVKHLRGMFAFALWDGRQRRLLLARDRFGQKPLLYAQSSQGLTFASEFKAILQDPAVSREVDYEALHHYLTYGYVPAPISAFRHIRKLPPASTLIWEAGQIEIERYWHLEYSPKLNLGEADAAGQLSDLLREATEIRLMSDVPLGAFLSGGIDSGAVVAFMAQTMSQPVKTFSIGFEDQSFNELDYARQVAKKYTTDHYEFIVMPNALKVLPELVWAYGEPFADSSALPTYYVAQQTRQYVTVALNGDGGDEAFAGYDRYWATRLALQYQRVPRWLRRGIISPFVQRLPETTHRRDMALRLKRFVSALDDTPERRYARWMSLLSHPAKLNCYTPEFRGQMAQVDSWAILEQVYAAADNPDIVERTMMVDTQTYLPDDLLVKVDIATMLHSLEGRSPFLDHKLAEFVARLPVAYKLRGRVSKYILKQALSNHLPASILKRGKQGFGVPIGRWFRHQLKQVAYNVLLDQRALERGLFSKTSIATLLDNHVSGRVNYGQQIWALVMLELWFRTYVDQPPTSLTGPTETLI